MRNDDFVTLASESQRAVRTKAFVDAILAGLTANAITAVVVALVATAGGFVTVAKGVGLTLLALLSVAFVSGPVLASRRWNKDQFKGTGLHPGKVMAGSLIYMVIGASILGIILKGILG